MEMNKILGLSVGVPGVAAFGSGLGLGYMRSKGIDLEYQMVENAMVIVPMAANMVVGGYLGSLLGFISNMPGYTKKDLAFGAAGGAFTGALVSGLETAIGYAIGNTIGNII